MRRYYKVDEQVWIKKLKKVGKVVSLDIPNLEASISYYDGEDLITRKMKFMEIDKLRLHDSKEKTGQKRNKKRKLTIHVKYFDGDMQELEKITKGDWIDLRSAVTLKYKAGDSIVLPLGIAMSLPYGYEAHTAPRGSTFKNYGVIQTNSVGVVDESYKGNDDEWFLPLFAMRDGMIEKGDRIAQFRIMKKMEEIEFKKVDMLKSPNRGGHGSTGTK